MKENLPRTKMIPTSKLLLTILVFGLSLSLFGSEKPNVILIMTDDQGYGDIRSHGNRLIDTPHLDKLAAEGVRFENFFVSPLCAPTRASLLTGRYHIRTGTVNVSNNLEIMRPEEITIAELLKANGYKTGLFGKWHNGEHYPYNPNGQGFDEFVGFCAGHIGNYFDPVLEHNTGTIETEGFITDVLTDKALEWIEANQNSPFFCYIPYNAPHTPYQVPDAYYDKYMKRGYDVKTASIYGMVENMDDNIGRLLGELEKLGLDENTIILFLTDNGPNTPNRYNAGMKGYKGAVDEGGVRVPLFVRWPGEIQQNIVIHELAAHIDILPTLMDICQIEIPENLQVDGISLKSRLLDNKSLLNDRIIFTHRFRGIEEGSINAFNGSARSSQYRYVRSRGEEQLFDLINDPGQKTDISKEQAAQFRHFQKAYQNWFSDVSDGWELQSVIPCGYREFPITHLHAVQSSLSGKLKFHGRGFHHDWIVNWVDPTDTITWDINVVESGRYRVAVRYVCPEQDVGSSFNIKIAGKKLHGQIDKAYDPDLYPVYDRAPRSGELEKPWATLELGEIDVPRGVTQLVLSAESMPGNQVMEVREVILERADDN